jgi:hypothetical protein
MTIALKARVNVVSRSRIKYFIMAPLSWRSMMRFLASCGPVGVGVCGSTEDR